MRSSIEQRKARISGSKGQVKRKSAAKVKAFINESLVTKVNETVDSNPKKSKNEASILTNNGAKQASGLLSSLNQSCIVKKPKETELNSFIEKTKLNKSTNKATWQISGKFSKPNSAVNSNQTISYHHFSSVEIEPKTKEIFIVNHK